MWRRVDSRPTVFKCKFLLPSQYDCSSSCLTRSTSCLHQLFWFVQLDSELLNFLGYFLTSHIVRPQYVIAKLVSHTSDVCTLRQTLNWEVIWGGASTLLYYLTSFRLWGSSSICCPILGSVYQKYKKKDCIGHGTAIVSCSWCWYYGVVDWDWPQLQTALSYFNSFTSRNCIGGNRRKVFSAKGSPILSKKGLSWVDSPLSLGYMKDILSINWYK